MTGKEASDIIEEALNKVISESDDWEENDVLVEWIVISYVTNPDKEKGNSYPMYVSNGDIPSHHLRGLLMTAIKAYFINE